MQKIFVLMKCELGQSYKVAAALVDGLEEVSEVDSISGQYDLLAKFYLPRDLDVGRFVTEKVQTVAGVKDTFTLVAFNAFT
ncbi:Lrp/AsnC family transcriptional regulator [Roseospira marina]|uniref:Lrp/AsnC family transcriptional regulator n=1 Tax=Roseospira marina TaxID=140057 RepID=A0A5M6IBQ5_9PROT|nr:Lrp/AsnC ligand binding domain-containing protein [Roseospira marina]KAA5605671.1 Lrp/AsnC family transcriptional regulator [Roseospira marina]MBB4313251.1 DNA-binding Lrp family transcriptional regulator [Roseospira marina]MBB5086008.1 DNA-binding Lrp family transcriptional regulator [Roseospira marina]